MMSSNGNNILSLRNYISQHITKIINTRYPQLTPLEKQFKLQIIIGGWQKWKQMKENTARQPLFPKFQRQMSTPLIDVLQPSFA